MVRDRLNRDCRAEFDDRKKEADAAGLINQPSRILPIRNAGQW
jgi:hypothetical protein